MKKSRPSGVAQVVQRSPNSKFNELCKATEYKCGLLQSQKPSIPK
jgi:hypothetical protein